MPLTLCINMAGIPGLSIPCGRTETGLPIGLQLLGNFFREDTLLKAAYGYERAEAHRYLQTSPNLP